MKLAHMVFMLVCSLGARKDIQKLTLALVGQSAALFNAERVEKGCLSQASSPMRESSEAHKLSAGPPASFYYTILYYSILYSTLLYYTILYYTILYYTILYYSTII